MEYNLGSVITNALVRKIIYGLYVVAGVFFGASSVGFAACDIVDAGNKAIRRVVEQVLDSIEGGKHIRRRRQPHAGGILLGLVVVLEHESLRRRGR